MKKPPIKVPTKIECHCPHDFSTPILSEGGRRIGMMCRICNEPEPQGTPPAKKRKPPESLRMFDDRFYEKKP